MTININSSRGQIREEVNSSMGESNPQREKYPLRRRGRKGKDTQVGHTTKIKDSSSAAVHARQDATKSGSATKQLNNNNTSSTALHQTLLLKRGGNSNNSTDNDEGEEQWYDIGSSTTERNAVVSDQDSRKNTQAVVDKYRQLANNIYRREVQLFAQQTKNSNGDDGDRSSSNKDDQWVEATMRKGTLKDRVAAMSVVVSTNPIHKFYALDGLLQMTGCNTASNATRNTPTTGTNARVAQLAAEAVEDLFLHTFLPPNRKLISLTQRPLMRYEQQQQEPNDDVNPDTDKNGQKKRKKNKPTQATLSPRILLLWRFEEMVKERFDLFLRQYVAHTLQKEGSLTPISRGKSKNGSRTMTTPINSTSIDVHKLAALRTAATLLRSVPEGESLLLGWLVNKLGDPNRKVCASAAHELRRTLQPHPAMQPTVAREVQQLAHRPHLSNAALYNCVTFLNQLKLTRSVLSKATSTKTSIPTTTPPTKGKDESCLAASLINTYFRLFEVAIQRGNDQSTKQHTSSKNNEKAPMDSTNVSQSRLLSALLQGVNRARPYLPEADQAMNEHIDALYRVVHTSPPGAKTQSLLLLFHVAVGSKNDDSDSNLDSKVKDHEDADSRKDRFYRALFSTLLDPTMLSSGKHSTMYFNLLYKAMKNDTDTSRLVAFAKRIGSMALHCPSPVVAATIFLLNEIGKEHHPTLLSCYLEVLYGADALRVLDPLKREPSGALVSALDEKDPADAGGTRKRHDGNTEKRAPGWEVSLSKFHFHPSVRKFSSTMGDVNSSYTGDPLKDFALAPFLDKFAYRNPKSVERVAGRFKRGESIGERRSGTDSFIQTQFSLPVNDPNYWTQTSKIDEQDEFFHAFFRERARRDSVKGIVRHKGETTSAVEDDTMSQLDLLDREEARDADQYVNYDDYESKWESDEEEEAFVNSLAQKIIDDAMEGDMQELDDEDPDTEGWDDIYPNAGDGNEDDIGDEKFMIDDDASDSDDGDVDFDNKNKKTEVGEDFDDDVDAFMDVNDDSDSLDSDGKEHESISDGEVDNEEVDSENDFFPEESDEVGILENDEDDVSDDLVFDSESDDDDDDDESSQLVATFKLKNIGDGDTFASADDYAEMISKSWSAQKRSIVSEDPVEQQNGSVLDRSHDKQGTSSIKRQRKKRMRSNP